MKSNQLKAFWGLNRSLTRDHGLSKEDAEDCARDIIEKVSGQRSTRALSGSQGARVLQELRTRVKGEGPKELPEVPTSSGAPDIHALPTQGQLDTLDRFRKQMGWTPFRFRRFCETHARCGKPWPQTRGEANVIIEALKDWVSRESKADLRNAPRHKRELLAQSETLDLTSWELAFLSKVEKKRMTVLQRLKLEEIYKKRVGGELCD